MSKPSRECSGPWASRVLAARLRFALRSLAEFLKDFGGEALRLQFVLFDLPRLDSSRQSLLPYLTWTTDLSKRHRSLQSFLDDLCSAWSHCLPPPAFLSADQAFCP